MKRERTEASSDSAACARSAADSISARLARGEARGGGLGEHRDGALWIGALRRRRQDLVPAHHRTAADRDVAGELVDRDAGGRIGRGRAGLLEQCAGAFGQARRATRPRPPPSSSRARRSPSAASRAARSNAAAGRRVRAPIAAADAGLLERRRRRFVGPDGGRGQVPRAAIDVAVGQRGGERTVGGAALLDRSGGVDRRPGERMAELDRPRPERDAARRPRRPPAWRDRFRAGAPPARASADRRCRWSPPAPGRDERTRRVRRRAAGTHARCARTRAPERPRGRARGRARRRRARSARAGCRRWPRAGARRPPA